MAVRKYDASPDTNYLDIDGATRYFNLCATTIKKLARESGAKVKIGSSARYKKDILTEYIESMQNINRKERQFPNKKQKKNPFDDVKTVEERNRTIIEMRKAHITLSEISQLTGLSTQRISQIEQKNHKKEIQAFPGLSTRANNCLCRVGITNLELLKEAWLSRREDIHKIRNMGAQTLMEIREYSMEKGIYPGIYTESAEENRNFKRADMKVELTEEELNEIIRVLDYADNHIPSQKLYELSEKLKGERNGKRNTL